MHTLRNALAMLLMVISTHTTAESSEPADASDSAKSAVTETLQEIERAIETAVDEQAAPERERQIEIRADISPDGESFDLVGLIAVVLLFGMPVLIVGTVSYNNRRRYEQVHQTMARLIERDAEIPAALLEALDQGRTPRSRLHAGAVNCALGLGLGVFLWSVADWDVATLGLIPLLIGLAQLVIWRLEVPPPQSE